MRRVRPILLFAGVYAASLIAIALATAPASPSGAAGLAITGLASTASLLYAAAPWMLAALGWGVLARPLVRGAADAADRLAIEWCAGVAIMLTIAHALGLAGAFSPPAAWTSVGVGLALLAVRLRAAGTGLASMVDRVKPAHAVLAFPIALLTLTAAAPPGAMWASEGFGYDVTSYHLLLPRDWIDAGRLWPVEHNVYSFLPSAMEAAFAQLAAMTGASPDHPLGIAADLPVIAAAQLHSLVTILAAFTVGALAQRLTDGRVGILLPTLITLGTPWVIVVGSLAYNEGAMLALVAAAMLAAIQRSVPPVRRGLLIGLLMGGAACCKPTAIFMGAPACVLLMATNTPRRALVPSGAAAAIAGSLMLAPWLVRNWLACGNPVFPSLTSVFGSAHWSAEQVARWDSGHHLDLPALDRLARLADPAFGLTHPQWSATALLGLLGIGVAVAHGPTRRAGSLLAGVVGLQLLAWLTVGHLQSRFLLPTLVALAPGLALGAGALADRKPTAVVRRGAWVIAGVIALHAGLIATVAERGRLIQAASGIGVFNTSSIQDPTMLADAPWLRPIYLINNAPIGGERPVVLALGEARGLYLDPRRADLIIQTTWDPHPLADALRETGGELSSALDLVSETHGVTHLLVLASELRRLDESGWLDHALDPDALLPLITTGVRALQPPGPEQQDVSGLFPIEWFLDR